MYVYTYIHTCVYVYMYAYVIWFVTHRMPVCVHGGGRVLELHVLVAHERPGREKGAVQFECTTEIGHRLFVRALK